MMIYDPTPCRGYEPPAGISTSSDRRSSAHRFRIVSAWWKAVLIRPDELGL